MKIIILPAVLILLQISVFAQKTERFVAVTIDDLPVVSTRQDLAARQEITKKLLKHISEQRVPAIGFVNESKLYRKGERDEAEVDLLRRWLDAGLELGNHTFSHSSLHRVSLEQFEAEILRGELVTKELLQAKNKPLRYFRHPFLHTGKTLETKRKLSEFLSRHGYTIAPVSVDNEDYLFARALDNATERGDAKLAGRIGAAYAPYIESKFDYWERQSVKLFGREIKQILLLHANSINAEYLDDLARMLEKRGYQFIGLEDALRDEAYKLPDTATSGYGMSWLHRWAFDKGKGFVLPGEPPVPDFVLKEVGDLN